ncbi:MAG: phosphatidylglycerol lysyltransferase domain-containing protein [Muribaculaceae bacterium]|nr:phosphatidylglycerol lysyltransferase domain-containing protein [Muribaculaceae bacterium]
MENIISNSIVAAATVTAVPDINMLAERFGQLSGQLERIEPYTGPCPEFKPVTQSDMALIMTYLEQAPGRTTDYSYGGILMWVDYFKYEYCIIEDTLFIKGAVENDLSRESFAMPIGRLPLSQSLGILKAWCERHGTPLVMSAIPSEGLESLRPFLPKSVELLTDWGDYLYDAVDLAQLKGKRYSKKRNHVNQFMNGVADWHLEPLTAANAGEAMAFMDIFDLEGDDTPMAIEERQLTRNMVQAIADGDCVMEGALLYADGKVCAFTIGDRRGDTLFIHIEKATRHVPGSYEAINTLFARSMTEAYPEIKYINREDDSGDEGLRFAKESYHPVEVLKKYNVIF